MDVYHEGTANEYRTSTESFLADLKQFFPLVKLKKFNQAEILALYECMSSSKPLRNGKLLTEEQQFHEWLDKALAKSLETKCTE